LDVIFWNSDPHDWNYFTRYIGPYKLGHWLRKHGYSAQVIDFIVHMTEEQLYTYTKKFITSETTIIGVSATFMAFKMHVWPDGTKASFPKHIIDVGLRIKREYPNIKFVIGGYGADHLYMGGIPHATIMSYTSACEDIFLEYLDHYKKGTQLPLGKLHTSYYGLNSIKNPKFRMMYDTARNPKYNIEHDDFKWHESDVVLKNEPLPLDISRGCIFACRFCQYPHLGKGKLDYIRGMEYIKEEMLDNYAKFGTTNYMILDDTFNDTEIKLRAFNDMVQSLPFKITYSAYLRADLIDRFPDTAYLLRDSGLFGAFHGLESLHPYASNLVGKAWSGKRAREYIPKLYHDLWESKIPMTLSFIVGLPKETEQDLWNTQRWVEDNDLYTVVFHKLGLFGNNNKNTKYTIQSEFDKNASKYGFTFDENNSWSNETWVENRAMEVTQKIFAHNKTTNYRKISIWNLGTMLSLGYSKEFLLKTPIKDIDNVTLKRLNLDRYADYFDQLAKL
jgi:radical SAM superfamily enzyme YgiQ (UPF0313 family)